TEERPHDAKPFTPPETCPSCGSALSKLRDEVALRCLNASCPAQIFAALTHFVSRGAMNIEGLGPALLAQLIEAGLVKNAADIFGLRAEDLAALPRMGEKSAANIMTAVELAKKRPLDKLLFGLGIRMVGSRAAATLAQNVKDIADLYTMSTDDFISIETIGPSMAESLRAYFDRPENRALCESLRSRGVYCAGLAGQAHKAGHLSGKSFVLTGALPHLTRQEATRRIEAAGGRVGAAVSKKTSFVIAGDEAGSKLDKAQTLGIPVLDEKGFLALFEGGV
ncbi:MAG: helix-hairpin-helix domain-containing protein, partial [Chitinivibrionales bacterium]|nr:helix-hairpin-helix domain-containing protein [Chitinivibrionales bacterium]